MTTRDKNRVAVTARSRLALCLIFGVVASTPRLARATPADEAEAFTQKGIQLRKEFKDQEALEQFQRAYQLVHEDRTLAQIGVAEQALGRWVDAEIHVDQALKASSDAWIAKNRDALEHALVVIRSHLGDLEIITSPIGADVRLDGREVGRSPFRAPLRARAGSVIIEVRAAGYFSVTRSVAVAAEELTRETVSLQRSSPGSATTVSAPVESIGGSTTPPIEKVPSPPPPDQQEWKRPLAWALAGGAVAFAGGGVAALIVHNDKAKSYNKLVDTTGCAGTDAMTCTDLKSDGSTAGTLAVVGFGLAGAMAIGSAVLFATSPSHGQGSVALTGCGVDWLHTKVACHVSF